MQCINQPETAETPPLNSPCTTSSSQAGRSTDVLLGSPTGVFVGCIWLEYGELLAAAGNPAGAYMVTGVA